MRISPYLILLILFQHVVASASPVRSPESDKLIRDVDHLVQVAEQTNWHIDTEELKSLRTDILLVICPASDALRQESLRILTERVAQHGDLKEQYALANQELAAIKLPLRHHRSLLLFKSGLDRAKEDCPFWMGQASPYTERHRPTEQFLLGFDGGGMFNVTPNSKPLRFGFGGSSRLSIGYGTSHNTIWRFGLEFGGAGLLDKEIEVDEVDVQFFAGLPIAFRYLWQIWFVETDLGPIALGLPWKQKPDVGGRVSAMFGFASPKISKVQPWAGLRFSTDYLPSLGIDNGLVLRTGIRFGIDYR